MSEISQRMLEAVEAHTLAAKEAREGVYRTPSTRGLVRAPVDTSHGPVRSVSVEDYLAEMASK